MVEGGNLMSNFLSQFSDSEDSVREGSPDKGDEWTICPNKKERIHKSGRIKENEIKRRFNSSRRSSISTDFEGLEKSFSPMNLSEKSKPRRLIYSLNKSTPPPSQVTLDEVIKEALSFDQVSTPKTAEIEPAPENSQESDIFNDSFNSYDIQFTQLESINKEEISTQADSEQEKEGPSYESSQNEFGFETASQKMINMVLKTTAKKIKLGEPNLIDDANQKGTSPPLIISQKHLNKTYPEPEFPSTSSCDKKMTYDKTLLMNVDDNYDSGISTNITRSVNNQSFTTLSERYLLKDNPMLKRSPSTKETSFYGKELHRNTILNSDVQDDQRDPEFELSLMSRKSNVPIDSSFLQNTISTTYENNSESEFDFSAPSEKKVSKLEQRIADAANLPSDFVDDWDDLNTSFPTQINAISTENKLSYALSSTTGLNKDKPQPQFGFSTASGKSISISEKSLAQARNLLSDVVDDFDDLSSEVIEDQKPRQDHNLPHAKIPTSDVDTDKPQPKFGFSTASDKNISVSEESLARARNLLSDVVDNCDDQSSEVIEDLKPKPESTLPPATIPTSDVNTDKPQSKFGFSTASGKNISVSEESLARARNLLSDVVDNCNNLTSEGIEGEKPRQDHNLPHATSDMIIDKPQPKFGFSTASGKSISISETSLACARNLLSDVVDNCGDLTSKAIEDLKPKPESTLPHAKIPTSDVNTDKPQPKFGFSMASGKSIFISETSLARARNLLSDVVDNWNDLSYEVIEDQKPRQDNNLPIATSDMIIDKPKPKFGFSSASGKSISISEKSLARARNLLSDNCDDLSSEVIEDQKPRQDHNLPHAKIPTSDVDTDKPQPKFGFSTASGKNISVSEESLARARNLLSDVVDNCDDLSSIAIEDLKPKPESILPHATIPTSNVNTVEPQPKFGFSKASGKSISISEKSLARARNLLSDVVDNCDDLSSIAIEDLKPKPESILPHATIPTSNVNTVKPQPKFGFSTASGKSISISETSLARARNLLSDVVDNCNDLSSEVIEDQKPRQDLNLPHAKIPTSDVDTDKPQPKFGFSTASGKNISVSEESLARARNLLSDVVDNCNNLTSEGIEGEKPRQDHNLPHPTIPTSNVNTVEPQPKFGFSTASGKSISISETSLARARNLLSDVFDNCDDLSSKAIEDLKPKPESTLPHAKIPTSDVNTDKPQPKFGFSTASGKSISISEKSLARARNLLSDVVDNCDDLSSIAIEDLKPKPESTLLHATIPTSNVNTVKPQPKFGFSTASGKDISVSEESLARARNLLSDVVDNCDDPICKSPTNTEGSKPGLGNNLPLATSDVNTDKPQPKFGFSTASGKSISISEKSLARARNLLSDALDNSNNPNFMLPVPGLDNDLTNTSISTTDVNADKPEAKFGFLTGSGSISCKSGEISANARSLLADDVDDKRDTPISGHDELGPTSSPASSVVRKRFGVNDRSLSHVGGEGVFSSTPFKHEMTISNSRGNKDESTYNSDDDEPFLGFETLEGSKRMDLEKVSTSENPASFSKPVKSQELFPESDLSLSLAHEVSESTAAWLADEQVGDDTWYRPYVTSPSFLTDCQNGISPIVSRNEDFDNSSPMASSSIVVTPRSRSFPCNSTPISRKRPSLLRTSVVKRHKIDPRVAALKKQEDKLSSKDVLIKPSPGTHLRRRLSEKTIPLKEAFGGSPPQKYAFEELIGFGLSPSVIRVMSSNAVDFRFSVENPSAGVVEVEDDVEVVVGEDGKVGVAEIEKALSASPCVDQRLLPPHWVSNHFRWIVWKLASLDTSFPHHISPNRALTLRNVIQQLKYRYDREIDRAERPVLRKILEKDEAASRRMVLCVASISRGDNAVVRLELTDGWYGVWASVDYETKRLIERKKLCVGTKVILCRALLVNTSDGVHPLQAGDTVRLHVSTNSMRRAAWWCRLGLARPAGPFTVLLSSLLPKGGHTPFFRGTVARLYPLLNLVKDSLGKTVVRSYEAERKALEKLERKRSELAESYFQEVWLEIEAEERKKKKRVTRRSLKIFEGITDPEMLCTIIDQAADPFSLEGMLSQEQMESVRRHRESEFSRKVAEVQERVKERLEEEVPIKQSTTLLKMRVVDADLEGSSGAVLTIWRPAPALVTLFREGTIIQFNNLVASGIRNGVLQLNSTNSSEYKEVGKAVKGEFAWWRRRATPLGAAILHKPLLGELDTCGLLLFISETSAALVDLNSPPNYLAITLAQGDSWECKEGELVHWVGLEARPGLGPRLASAFAPNTSVLSHSPPSHLRPLAESFKVQLASKKDVQAYLKNCKAEFEELMSKKRKREMVSDPGKRIRALEKYGEPPPLKPLLAKSPSTPFKSPIIKPSPPLSLSPG